MIIKDGDLLFMPKVVELFSKEMIAEDFKIYIEGVKVD